MEQKTAREIQRALTLPCAPEDLEWRLQTTLEDKMRGLAVPYVTNRAIQNRLDEVVGPDNWYNDYKPWHGAGKKEAQLCGIFEDFLTLLGGLNKRGTKLAVNSFYVIDDAKQRGKMAEEFYLAVKKEIAEYQDKCDYFIKSGSNSPAVMERWVLKVQALEQRKRHYEEVLRQELNGLDDEFTTLKFLAQELQIRADKLRSQKELQKSKFFPAGHTAGKAA